MNLFKNQILFSLFICCVSMYSCKNEKNEEKALYDQVMAVHNEVMPKISKVVTLKKALKKYSDALGDNNIPLKDSLISTILLLSQADDSMMDWMDGFKDPSGESHEKTMEYLQSEKQKVDQVKDKIEGSIGKAEVLLQNAPDSIKISK